MENKELIKLISEVMYFREPNLSPPDAMNLVSKFLDKTPKWRGKAVNNGVLDAVIVCDNCTELNRKTCFLGVTCPKCNKPFRSIRS